MGLARDAEKLLGRTRYAAAQSLRSAWYGAQYVAARRMAGGFDRPGEPPFRPQSGPLDRETLRTAFFDLFRQDMMNVEEGLYPAPKDVRLADLSGALSSARAFLRDVPDVDRRRTDRDGTEVRQSDAGSDNRFPAYYRQNFHYQSEGWLSDDSARLYDTQVETLFTGAADAMRRAALAEIARELKGQDQRDVAFLDLACGTGRFLGQVMRTFPRLGAQGLELSPNYAAAARTSVEKWPHVQIVEGMAERQPFDDQTFDLVVSIYLFHELPPRVRPLVFQEISRVLKPGGTFVFADSLQFGDRPGLDSILEYFPEGFHEPYYKGYLKADLGALLQEAGFELQRTNLAFLTKVQVWKKL
ncbi:MAG: class I SAM-dependent methyltransferase [Pseudomonadota bacterium]